MSEKPEDLKEAKDLKGLTPSERKTVWRTPGERKMSDLTRVLEWLERRKGKMKQSAEKQKVLVTEPPKGKWKEEKKGKGIWKQPEGTSKMKALERTAGLSSRMPKVSTALYQKPLGGEQPSMSTYDKDVAKRSELDIKDAMTLESTPRPNTFRRQSVYTDSSQDNIYGSRKMTGMRDWPSKTSDIAFDRKLKSLMEKGTEVKIETVKVLKPEEVLSCQYLRLSKNNIRTLLKLCKDVDMNMDIHPHMTESEIDVQKVFPAIKSSEAP